MEILVDQTSERNWHRLAGNSAFQQSWAYGAACAALGSRVLRLELRAEDGPIGVAQLVHRRLLGCLHAAVCTRGPVWSDAATPELRSKALVALRRALPFPWLRGLFVTPESGDTETGVLRQGGLSRVMTPYSTGIIDLTRPEDDLRASMHQKWRNRLVAAEQAGLSLGRADRRPQLYQWLLEEEARQQKARGYGALPVALIPAWHQAGGDLRVLTAKHGKETIAAMLFLLHGRRATYHLGWSSRRGKQLNAHNLILWQAMRKLKALGVGELDLGGLNTEDIPGIARFKLGAGAEVKTLCGTWFGR